MSAAVMTQDMAPGDAGRLLRGWTAARAPRAGTGKVPEVTLAFWVLKILATTLGETGGDTVTMTLNWGYLAGVVLFGGRAGSACADPDLGQELPAVSLLGDDHRLDDLRHGDGRLR